MKPGHIRSLGEVTRHDVRIAGGKGANLGEMYRSKLPVPEAFVLTTKAYRAFAERNGLDEKLQRRLKSIRMEDLRSVEEGAAALRKMVESSDIPKDIEAEIAQAYRELSKRFDSAAVPVAVRSSATTEDLRDASFAGQQITLLNVKGVDGVLRAVKKCWASVYTARATFYRAKQGFGSRTVDAAVVVQAQIMSEKAGVGFTIHPLTGNKTQMVIEAVFGQGEEIVSGRVVPDTFVLDKETGEVLEKRVVSKRRMKMASASGSGLVKGEVPARLREEPVLSEEELKRLWELGSVLENHYGYPQDFEWAIEKGTIYLLQTRAVTVIAKEAQEERVEEEPILKGLGASPGIGSGQVKVVRSLKDLGKVNQGDVLVTKMTTPDYVPLMIKTSGIVTDEGGMTSHAAIVSRELGVPCVVGTSNATKVLRDGMVASVDGSRGMVFRGRVRPVAASEETAAHLEEVRRLKTRTKVYMNLGVPDKIKAYTNVPFDGIGLMRVEFILASYVGQHPMHLVETGREDVLVDWLSEGIAAVAREISPRPLVVRFSDFKTNEYRELEGGEKYEDVESNPMLGWRGVSRYISPEYVKAFQMELGAIKRVRERMGLTNVWVMLPFVRTTWEVERCIELIAEQGLKRSETFKVWLMAEVPSMVFLAEEFASLCDGFSIGSNDLTQLIMGIDRDSGRLAKMGYFDERNEAVKRAIKMLIEGAHKQGKTVSICGQAPSVYPDFAEYLVSLGIDSISVSPDSVARTKELVFRAESRVLGGDGPSKRDESRLALGQSGPGA